MAPRAVTSATNLSKALRGGVRSTVLGTTVGAALTGASAGLLALDVIDGTVVTIIALTITPLAAVGTSRAAGGHYGSCVVAAVLAGVVGGALLGWLDYTPCDPSHLPADFVCGNRLDAARAGAELFGLLNGIVGAFSARWPEGTTDRVVGAD